MDIDELADELEAVIMSDYFDDELLDRTVALLDEETLHDFATRVYPYIDEPAFDIIHPIAHVVAQDRVATSPYIDSVVMDRYDIEELINFVKFNSEMVHADSVFTKLRVSELREVLKSALEKVMTDRGSW